MNPMRRATPDSEAMASSEDEKPWPAAPSFGSLPRKENGVPGLGGSIWTQKRGSISKMDKAPRTNVSVAPRDARLGPPATSPNLLRSTPSPSANEDSAALPFAIPLHPNPKTGRSLSHSQGQREILASHPSAGEQSSALPLGLLSEEVDNEDDSEMGGPLTHTVSHPAPPTFYRSAFYTPIYDAVRTPSDSGEMGGAGRSKFSKGDRNFEGGLGHLSPDQGRWLWDSHLGWEDLPGANESRRHSLAEIPTRRGSLTTTSVQNPGAQLRGGAYWSPSSETYEFGHGQQGEYGENTLFQTKSNVARPTPPDATKMKFNDKDEQGQPLEVPSMYKVPFIEIADHERTEVDKRAAAAGNLATQAQFGTGRPRKQLYIVSFKCSRVDVFYLLENTGLFIKEGDIVIVEADRGQDLGTVQHANVSPDEARLYKRKYGEEQYKWLMMFSRNNAQGSVNPNAQVYGENQATRSNLLAGAPPAMQGLPRDNFNNLKPKAIKRLANSREIRMLGEKEGNEAKAKRTCQQKVNHLHLDMEILDAEWQWDFQKLIFYYYADHYINFKDLITELYRIYKTRIWLSAINPASFSQHALGQPPSGIGPGAIGSYTPGVNNTYTMAYGPDPDPYGAVPPYRIGYETYTPNYPGIPGVANSFAPPGAAFQPAGAAPSVAPGVAPTGTMEDYNFYYDRSAGGAGGAGGAGVGGSEDPNPFRPLFHAGPGPGPPGDPFQLFNPGLSASAGAFQPTPPPGGPIGFQQQQHTGNLTHLGAIGSRGQQQPSNANGHGNNGIGAAAQQTTPLGASGGSGGAGESSRRHFASSRLSGSADVVTSPLLAQGLGLQQQPLGGAPQDQRSTSQQQQQLGGLAQQVSSPTTSTGQGGEKGWGRGDGAGASSSSQAQQADAIHNYMQGLQIRDR